MIVIYPCLSHPNIWHIVMSSDAYQEPDDFDSCEVDESDHSSYSSENDYLEDVIGAGCALQHVIRNEPSCSTEDEN